MFVFLYYPMKIRIIMLCYIGMSFLHRGRFLFEGAAMLHCHFSTVPQMHPRSIVQTGLFIYLQLWFLDTTLCGEYRFATFVEN